MSQGAASTIGSCAKKLDHFPKLIEAKLAGGA